MLKFLASEVNWAQDMCLLGFWLGYLYHCMFWGFLCWHRALPVSNHSPAPQALELRVCTTTTSQFPLLKILHYLKHQRSWIPTVSTGWSTPLQSSVSTEWRCNPEVESDVAWLSTQKHTQSASKVRLSFFEMNTQYYR